MKLLPDGCVDAVITDPPYNVGYHYEGYHDALKDEEYQELLRQTLSPPSVVIHYPEDMFLVSLAINELPEKCAAWIYNANTPRQWRMAAWFGIRPDFSLVKQPYKNQGDRRIRELIARGSLGGDLYDWWDIQQVKNVSDEKTDHPCQIPIEVMENIIGVTPAETILDPFLGSGTTAVAAKKLGRHFLGFEINPDYCKIAEERIGLVEAQPNLFEPKPEQLNLVEKNG
jgi:DNA modification methylase